MSRAPGLLAPAENDPHASLPRFWPRWWTGKWGTTLAWSVFAFVNGGISTAILAVLSHFAHGPLIFPSIGPTAFLLFHRPLSPAACPRNCLAGHLIGLLVGWLSLAVCGLVDTPPEVKEGVSGMRIVAAALSVGLTSGLMVLLRVPHPPAGATTLIVSLGLMHEPLETALLLVGVVMLVVQGFAINRLAGIPYPVWGPVDPQTQKDRCPSG